MGTQEHLTWNHEDLPKVHVPHPKFTLIHNTTPHGPHLARHPVPHKYFIHTRDLGNKLPHPTNERGTDGWMQTHKGGILIPMSQVLPLEKPRT